LNSTRKYGTIWAQIGTAHPAAVDRRDVIVERRKTVFTTERGARQQQLALDAAPDVLEVVMLRQPDMQTLSAHLADAQYLISERVGVIDAEITGAAPRLELIQRLGSLWHDIDLAAAQAAGVAVCYWPIRSVIRASEHAVMQMLALTKRLRETEAVALQASPHWGKSRRTDEDTFAYNWSGRRNVEGLWRKTVGILGFGEIGVELARRLQGWDCTLLYHKRRRLPEAVEVDLGIVYAAREVLLAQSDLLVNLLPYTPGTDLSLGADAWAHMKSGAYVVSCGSGSVIDETALAEAVRSGRLAGAALDTFQWEPLRADNPLLTLARQGYNVLLTPHVAAGATAAHLQGRHEEYANLLHHIAGRPLQYRVV
jgi:phosphoglycerate dehydrogenase-like enzyme